MTDTIKRYDVTYICPLKNKPITFLHVRAPQIYTDKNGDLRFIYDHKYDACEVISIKEVNADYTKSMESYFLDFGTAGE